MWRTIQSLLACPKHISIHVFVGDHGNSYHKHRPNWKPVEPFLVLGVNFFVFLVVLHSQQEENIQGNGIKTGTKYSYD